jgi:hypothetical protein
MIGILAMDPTAARLGLTRCGPAEPSLKRGRVREGRPGKDSQERPGGGRSLVGRSGEGGGGGRSGKAIHCRRHLRRSRRLRRGGRLRHGPNFGRRLYGARPAEERSYRMFGVAAVGQAGEAFEDVPRRRVASPNQRPRRCEDIEQHHHDAEAVGVLGGVSLLVDEQPGSPVEDLRPLVPQQDYVAEGECRSSLRRNSESVAPANNQPVRATGETSPADRGGDQPQQCGAIDDVDERPHPIARLHPFSVAAVSPSA